MEEDSGQRMHALAERLFPLCRSITGDGLRESLRMLSEKIPIEIKAVPSGTRVFDWSVPQEWKVREAWIRDSSGNDLVNFHDHNLHLVSYSRPVRLRMSLPELLPHLHSNPNMPDAIPYRTGYYNEDWGFCLTQNALDQLDDGEYDVCVDTELFHGELNYGELLIPGIGDEEVLISCHCCHPQWRMTTSRAWSWPPSLHRACWINPCAIPIGSYLFRVRSDPSHGWHRMSH